MTTTTSKPAPRPLRDIVRDMEIRDVPVTRKLVEEAIASVAADGVVSQDEVDALEAYGDGVGSYSRDRVRESAAWKNGTEAGRALINGLSDAMEALYSHEKYHGKMTEVKTEGGGFNPFNPWSFWVPGSSSVKGAAVTPEKLKADVFAHSIGWLDNKVDDLLRAYPKSTVPDRTMTVIPLPPVKAAIDALRKDWSAGTINETDIAAPLKKLLQEKYR